MSFSKVPVRKRPIRAWMLAIVTLFTSAAGHTAVPVVAVDIAPVHALVAQVMGDLGSPRMLVSPGASPHAYSMRPSEAQALQNADIVFWIGPTLTPGLAQTIETLAAEAASVRLLSVAGTHLLAQRSDALFDAHSHAPATPPAADRQPADDPAHRHDHAAAHTGDDAAEHPDPHAWLDPANAAVWLERIAAELARLDPANAARYTANAAAATDRLQALRADIESVLKPVRGRHFIVFHDAYRYFEEAFDMPASGAVSISDASPPGPARLRQIQARIRKAKVSCVLAEPQFNPQLVDTVLDGSDARTATLDPLGAHLEPGPGLYAVLLRELASTLAGCL